MNLSDDEITVQNEPVADHYMTLNELAGYLAVPVSTLRYWRMNGTGPPALKFGKCLRFRRSDVDAWTKAHTEQVA